VNGALNILAGVGLLLLAVAFATAALSALGKEKQESGSQDLLSPSQPTRSSASPRSSHRSYR
jgi:hypothetical protein